jgi:hypothetical protein
MLLKSKPIAIRLSHKADKCYKYLQSKKVNAAHYLREGGEQAVIDKAIEFHFEEKNEKLPF